MIAGNVDQPRARATFREERPNHVGVLVCPKESLSQAQRIDDVAGQHDLLGIDALQKLGQLANAGVFVAEMDIRQKQRTDFAGSPELTYRHAPRVVGRCVVQMTARLSIFYVTGSCEGNLNRRRLWHPCDLHAAQREMANEAAAGAQSAFDFQLGPMAL